MEKLLVMWMDDPNKNYISVTMLTIKPRYLFSDLKRQHNDTIYDQDFTAVHGWLICFKKYHSFHSIKITSKTANADTEAAEKFKKDLYVYIDLP